MDAAHQIEETENGGEMANNLPQAQSFPDSQQLQNIEPEHEIVPKNVSEGDRSLVSLLAKVPKLRQRILELQQDHPEYFVMDEPTFKANHRDLITLVTQRIRVSLWQEFEGAICNNRLMRLNQIFAGTCGETTFYSLIDNPIRLAYILCPPVDYIVMLKEAHGAGLEKLREIFSAQIIDEEGFLNPKAAEVVIKAFALLDARLKGAVVQRIDQRTLTASVSSKEITAALGIPADMDVLELELQKARRQIEQYTRVPRNPTPIELAEEMKDIIIDVVDMNANKELGGNSKILK